MGDANEGKRTFNWMENLSLQTSINPRDFLHEFLLIDTRKIAGKSSHNDDKDEEGIELNLGLSLGGRFGVDKNENRLIRSSSIASTFSIVRDDNKDVAASVAVPRQQVLGRTASLPVVTEEWKKRKELQMLRRMAAKRRRNEKQRVYRGEREGIPPNWVAARGAAVVAGGIGVEQLKGVDSLGGSSSGGSQSVQGSSSCGEASPASVQSNQNRSHREAAGSSGSKGKENVSNSIAKDIEKPSKRHENVEKRNKETGLNSLEDMPCVFTQGDGPNGRRIEGILYRYGKGEQVRIMCVCHGRFLSPAEFVEHAGGTDVAHPLKHIVVNPSTNSFL